MDLRSKIVKFTVQILGGLATILFLITKNATALNWATSGDYRYGDLFHFAKIARFKPSAPIPRGPTNNRDSIDQGNQLPNQQEAVFLGDSFGFSDWGEGSFEEQLQQRTGTRLFSVYNNHHAAFWTNPYLLMESQTNRLATRGVFVYEIAERLIAWQFANALDTNGTPSQTAVASGFYSRSWGEIKNVMFSNTESRHEQLLKHGYLTSPIIGFWNTGVFEVFRKAPPETPLYSLRPPFLFYKDEVECFESNHDEQLVTRLADNIAGMDRTLASRFGYKLVFIPVPNKITLYSKLVTDRNYDGYLPRLCSDLKRRGVLTVDLLQTFQNETSLLYWPTDTHWNDLGIRIAAQQTIEALPQPRSK